MSTSSRTRALAVVATLSGLLVGGLTGTASATHSGSGGPDATANSVAATGHTANIGRNPANGGQATIRYADTAASGWRTTYGIANNNSYAPNSLELTRSGGAGSGQTCAGSGGHSPSGSSNLTRCVDMTSGNYPSSGNVGEYCGPSCGPFMDGTYTAGDQFKIVFNDSHGSSTATGNENVVAHEVAHSVGFPHHSAQEYANGRWYPGAIGEWSAELRDWFDDPYYDANNQKHVLNVHEKGALNGAYGDSSAP